MSIRDAIEQLLTGETLAEGQGGDPAAILAEHGHQDVPTELFGTALVHFSDTAPLAQADALAPVVTRVSPIPFEEDDLPPLEGAEGIEDALDGSDPYALFEAAPPVLSDLDDLDTDGLDDVDTESGPLDDSDEEMDDSDIDEDAEDSHEFTEDQPGEENLTEETDFGAGTTDPDSETAEDIEHQDISDVQFSGTDDDSMLDDLAPRFDPSQHLGEVADEIEVEGTDLFSVEFDESDQVDHDADPDDLDFDVD